VLKRIPKLWLRRLFISICISLMLIIITYFTMLKLYPFDQDKIDNITYSKVIYDKDNNLLRGFLNKDDCWLFEVNLNEVNPNFIKATIAIEDKRFYSHYGCDPLAVMRALSQNIINQETISGASTISMQVIRLLSPKKRTLFNKLIETVQAIEFERRYSKEDILKFYFELAPYGGNINGVKAASLRYFNKYPEDLSISECALLAGLPQSPSRLRPDRHPLRAKKRRNMVLKSMLECSYIDSNEYSQLINEEVIAHNNPLPFKAPHFSRYVKNEYKDKDVILSSLDSNLQYYAQEVIKETISNLRPCGVTNGAVVVIENKTGKVRALVGSADFFSFKDCGQIDGSRSKRSPGSALKPFTYAIGIDKGLYTPRMVLADVPVEYSGYMPQDYDKKFRGPVSVREALVSSLNVPAVEVLDKIGYRNLYYLLEEAGISSLNHPPEYYGLPLTLGSADVSLLELTNAYAALAREGMYMPYSLIEDDSSNTSDSKRILSQGSCYITSDILSDDERLAAIDIYRDNKTHPKIAFKTGTSFGHRDAWTISYNPEYTVGIWLGNFSARPSKALVGLEAATPLAVRMFDWLYLNKAACWYVRPDSVQERLVCSLSGEAAGDDCPHAVKDLYLKDKSITKTCSYHKRIAIDLETERALCESDKAQRHYIEDVFIIWPDKLQAWVRQHDPDYIKPPEYLKEEKKAVSLDKNRPHILSPLHRCEYFRINIPNSNQHLALEANASFDADKLYWFINDTFYDTSKVGQKLFWKMEAGRHKITCVDKHGRSSFIRIVVR